jgi:hypothetical protein
MDWLIRRENIKHYRALLEKTVDRAERQKIKILLTAEEVKGLERLIESPSSFPTDCLRKARRGGPCRVGAQ